MYPILLDWNGVMIPSWHFFYMIGSILAMLSLFHLNVKWQAFIPQKDLAMFYAWSYCATYFGARLFSVFNEESKHLHSTIDVIDRVFSFGPMTFFGGFLAAFFIGVVFTFYKKVSKSTLFDLAIMSGFLALAIGRWGCFLNGDDYGVMISSLNFKTDPWWSVVYLNHPLKVPRVPVQIFESLLVFLALIPLWKYGGWLREKIAPGVCGFILLQYYCVIRFFLEYLRGDPRGWIIPGVLSPAQFISLFIFVFGMLFLLTIKQVSKNNSKH